MTTSEKVAYLKGMAEGMGIDDTTKEGKLFKVIIDVLEDLALDLADTKDSLVDLTDGVEELNESLAELEDDFYDSPCSACRGDEDEDDDEEPIFYSVECPHCGFKVTVDEDIMDTGSFECPECGEPIDLTHATLEEVSFEDEDEDKD